MYKQVQVVLRFWEEGQKSGNNPYSKREIHNQSLICIIHKLHIRIQILQFTDSWVRNVQKLANIIILHNWDNTSNLNFIHFNDNCTTLCFRPMKVTRLCLSGAQLSLLPPPPPPQAMCNRKAFTIHLQIASSNPNDATAIHVALSMVTTSDTSQSRVSIYQFSSKKYKPR